MSYLAVIVVIWEFTTARCGEVCQNGCVPLSLRRSRHFRETRRSNEGCTLWISLSECDAISTCYRSCQGIESLNFFKTDWLALVRVTESSSAGTISPTS